LLAIRVEAVVYILTQKAQRKGITEITA